MFKDELKKLRLERGWTQDTLAKKMGVAISTISMYENGNRTPDLETLELIADLFNVEISRFKTTGYYSFESVQGHIIGLLKYRKKSLENLSKVISVDYNVLCTYIFDTPENNFSKNDEILQKIAQALDVSIDYFFNYVYSCDNTFLNYISSLFERIERNLPLTEKESKILCNYINGNLSEVRIDNIIPLPDTRAIPLLGDIACGSPILAEENIEMFIRLDTAIPADFALRCHGDSMINARIFDGDIVYIRQQADVDDGDIAAVLINNEATLKKVYKFPQKLVLRPCNPMYEDLIFTDKELENISILGKAVAFTSILN